MSCNICHISHTTFHAVLPHLMLTSIAPAPCRHSMFSSAQLKSYASIAPGPADAAPSRSPYYEEHPCTIQNFFGREEVMPLQSKSFCRKGIPSCKENIPTIRQSLHCERNPCSQLLKIQVLNVFPDPRASNCCMHTFLEDSAGCTTV